MYYVWCYVSLVTELNVGKGAPKINQCTTRLHRVQLTIFCVSWVPLSYIPCSCYVCWCDEWPVPSSTLSSTTIYHPYNWWQRRSFISTPYFISSSVLQFCPALVLHLYFITLGVNFYVPRLLWSTIYPVPLTSPSYFDSTCSGELTMLSLRLLSTCSCSSCSTWFKWNLSLSFW